MRASWSPVFLCYWYPVCVGDSVFCSSRNNINLSSLCWWQYFPFFQKWYQSIQSVLVTVFSVLPEMISIYPVCVSDSIFCSSRNDINLSSLCWWQYFLFFQKWYQSIQSVLVTVFSVLPEMISIFSWLLTLEGDSGGWWGSNWLGSSCLCFFMDWDDGSFFSHKAGTVPFFRDSLKSSRSVFLIAGPRCLIMSFVTPSGPGAVLHFNCLIATSVSFMMMGWLMQLSYVGCFCSWVSCSLTWQVLSLGSLTLLSSWYSFARQLAASFWAMSSPIWL